MASRNAPTSPKSPPPRQSERSSWREDPKLWNNTPQRTSSRVAESRFSSSRDVVDNDAPDQAMMRREAEELAELRRTNPELYARIMEKEQVTLRDAMTLDDFGEELDTEAVAARVDSWRALCRFIYQDGINDPSQAFKNLLAVTRRACPDVLGGISQTTLAMILGEVKATVSLREKRVVETTLKRFGNLGYQLLGDLKTVDHRTACARSQKNNKNRKKGMEKERRRIIDADMRRAARK